MSVPPAFDLQGLLAEDQWIRRLARRLAGDAAGEDLAQEAWAAALDARAEAPRPRAVRPWLRGIVRNLWIDATRAREGRAERERRVARDEALEPASELVAELELRKHVAEALLALEEPYRSALYLRFFKDQSLAQIAKRQGVALSSAHERVQHGLARLRARLDQAHGGRRAWAVGLMALAKPAGLATAAAEAIAMAGGLKLAASVVVIGGGVAWFLAERSGEPRAPLAAAAADFAAHEAPRPEQLRASSDVAVAQAAREAEVPGVQAVAAPAPVAASAPALFRGHVVDPSGAPMPAVAIGWSSAPPAGVHPRSAPDGSFALELGGDESVRCFEPDLATLVPATIGATDEVGRRENTLLVVAPRADFAGVVLDPDGAPVAGARVSFRLRDELYLALGLHRGEVEHERWRTSSDERGAFALTGVAGGARVFLEVTAAGFEYAMLDLPPSGASDLVVRLRRGTSALTLHGIVLDPHGAPLADARVSAGEDVVRSGSDGRFAVRLFELPDTQAPDLQAAWRARQLVPGAQLVALAPGMMPAREPLAGIDPASEIVLRMGASPEEISGRVLDERGEPLAGVVVWPRDPTPFGRELTSMSEGMTVSWSTVVEDELAGGFGSRGATSDERGAFVLAGLLPRTYALMAFRPETCERAGPFAIEAGSRGIELVLPRDERRGMVAGRLVSAGGKPLAGVRVSAERTVAEKDAHAAPPMSHRHTVVTDDDGRFALGELALDGTALHLEDPRLFLRTVPLAAHPDPAHLELVEAVLCELQVDVTDTPALADGLRALDAEGNAVEMLESFGNAWSVDTSAGISKGLSPVLLVRETAVTLVLLSHEQEVLRRPLHVEPGQRTTVRP